MAEQATNVINNMQFTTTIRGELVLSYNGYQYTKKRSYVYNTEWRCRTRPCTTTLSLCRSDNSIHRGPGVHSCVPLPTSHKVVIDEAIANMKKRAREETLPIPQIYSQEIVKVRVNNPGMETGTFFPLLQSIDSCLYRKRSKNYPKLAKNISELLIPDEWKLDLHGQPFLIVDESYNGERLLMFCSEWSLEFLASCGQWHSDGTFKCRPLLFEQIYILFGFNNTMIPCIYCLTTKRDEELYVKILQHLLSIGKKQGISFNPLRLTCDFELATMNAFKTVFPSIHIANCFFHYSQSLWRKVQELGLTKYVKSSTSSKSNKTPSEEKKKANEWFLSAVGLALIPPNIIESTWTMAMDECTPDHDNGVKFNDYMVSTYVDTSSSRFHFNTWNVNDAIINKIPRTNNHVEGYNGRLGALFPIHPHMFRFIELLRDEHLFQQHHAEQSISFAPRRRKSSDDITTELLSLLKKYKKGELTDLELSIKCGKAVKTKLVIK